MSGSGVRGAPTWHSCSGRPSAWRRWCSAGTRVRPPGSQSGNAGRSLRREEVSGRAGDSCLLKAPRPQLTRGPRLPSATRQRGNRSLTQTLHTPLTGRHCVARGHKPTTLNRKALSPQNVKSTEGPVSQEIKTQDTKDCDGVTVLQPTQAMDTKCSSSSAKRRET